jgi:hypothetical protein
MEFFSSAERMTDEKTYILELDHRHKFGAFL